MFKIGPDSTNRQVGGGWGGLLRRRAPGEGPGPSGLPAVGIMTKVDDTYWVPPKVRCFVVRSSHGADELGTRGLQEVGPSVWH